MKVDTPENPYSAGQCNEGEPQYHPPIDDVITGTTLSRWTLLRQNSVVVA